MGIGLGKLGGAGKRQVKHAAVRAACEALEGRQLLAGPATPSLSVQSMTPTSITLAYSYDGLSALTLEEQGPGEQNYHTSSGTWDRSAHTITLAAQPDTRYDFLLRAELDCVDAEATTTAQTPPPDQSTGDESLPAPVLEAAHGAYSAYPPTPNTPVGVYFPPAPAPAVRYYYEQRWDDRPDFLGGAVWGIASPLQTGGGAGAYVAGNRDLWFGEHPGFRYSIRAYAADEYGLHSSPWSESFSGTVGGSATTAPTLTATLVGTNNVDLSWSGPADFYTVLGGDGAGHTIALTYPSQYAGMPMHLSGLAAGVWKFVVFSATSAMSSPASVEVGVPATPTALKAMAYNVGDEQTIRLAWGNASSNETNYVVERATKPDFSDVTTVASPGADVCTYEDTSADVDTTYYYRVYAANSNGSSPVAGPANATIHYAYIVGFYGADVNITGLPSNGGNPAITEIATELTNKGLEVHMYNRTASGLFWDGWGTAYGDLIATLDTNGDGQYDPTGYWTDNGNLYHSGEYVDSNGVRHVPDATRSIRIFGYSWGGDSALNLATKICQDKDFKGHNTIDALYTIDPVATVGDLKPLPGCVQTFQNWYQTIDTGSLGGIPVWGQPVLNTANNTCLNGTLQGILGQNPPPGQYDAAHAAIAWYVYKNLNIVSLLSC